MEETVIKVVIAWIVDQVTPDTIHEMKTKNLSSQPNFNEPPKIPYWKFIDRVNRKKLEIVAQTEGCSYAKRTECIPYLEYLTKSDDRGAVSPEWLQAVQAVQVITGRVQLRGA